MLHIATPIFRPELLEKVYNSIPAYTDIIWHIAQAKSKPVPNFSFIGKDNRIRIYIVDCLDTDTVSKRNAIFENIKDGYFYLLDDDTTLLPKVYELYKMMESKKFKGMVIGNQINKLGEHRIHASIPVSTGIDTGSVICCSEVLKQVRWRAVAGEFNDYLFWKTCYDILGDNNTILFHEPISIHNALR